MRRRLPRRRRADGSMTLLAHLLEVQRRLVRAAAAVLVGGVVGWILTNLIWSQLESPLVAMAKSNGVVARINFTTVTAAFDLRLQMAITIGLVLSCPVWLYQIFAFLVPGLTKREKRGAIGFVIAAVPLFLGGCLAGWLVFPHVVAIMTSFVPTGGATLLDAKGYLEFVMKLMLVTGVAFVLPLLLVVLNAAGVLTSRSILGSWRWAIIAITLFTAIATPSADVVSMLLLALPMVVLFFGAVGVTAVHDSRVARRLNTELEAVAVL